MTGLQLAVDILQHLAGCNRRLLPGCILVRKFGPLGIRFVPVVPDMKKISRHAAVLSQCASKIWHLYRRGDQEAYLLIEGLTGEGRARAGPPLFFRRVA